MKKWTRALWAIFVNVMALAAALMALLFSAAITYIVVKSLWLLLLFVARQ